MTVSDAYPRPFDERRASLAERGGLLGLDPLLLLAALGLIGFGIFSLGEVTGGRRPARSLLLRHPPGDLRGDRLALMLALARVDYSRFRSYASAFTRP